MLVNHAERLARVEDQKVGGGNLTFFEHDDVADFELLPADLLEEFCGSRHVREHRRLRHCLDRCMEARHLMQHAFSLIAVSLRELRAATVGCYIRSMKGRDCCWCRRLTSSTAATL